jgi:hypothetical protein
MKKVCRQECEYWAADPDSEYCAHPKALELSFGFGVNLDRARGASGFKPYKPEDDPAYNICGPEGKLWKIRSPEKRPDTSTNSAG